MAEPPPPPPPPHGQQPPRPPGGGSAGPMPDGNYDIFIIPPHSAGSGFLYLPSLQPHRNSFLAGAASAFVAVALYSILFPILKRWYFLIMAGGGGIGVLLLVAMIGVAGWALGKTHGEHNARGGGGGNTEGSRSQQSSWAPPPREPPPHQHAPPPNYQTPPHQQQQHQAPPPHEPPPQHHAPPPNYHAPPKPEPRSPPKPSGAASGWEKAREETRKREEERRRAEELRKKREEIQKQKEEAERAAKAKAEKERWEQARAREKDQREREARERIARERLEREREAREKREKENAEREAAEKAKTEKEKAGKEKAERERLQKEQDERDLNAIKERIAASVRSSPSKPATSKYEKPTARSFVGTEEEHSYRPYDRRPAYKSSASSIISGMSGSYAPSNSTARTSPPPSHRGPYSTSDPDKIQIKAVYLFSDSFPLKPIASLVAGVGAVTDGLVLRITSEGLFIDDDLRKVPQREWDVKAWTLKAVEDGIFRSSSPNSAAANGLHVVRATARDAENKKYTFILDESEAWKVALGLKNLKEGSQVRSLGTKGMKEPDVKSLLGGLGWL